MTGDGGMLTTGDATEQWHLKWAVVPCQCGIEQYQLLQLLTLL